MTTIRISIVVLWSLLLVAAGAVFADEPPLLFLHALQDNGYGDMAVEYLKTLEKQSDLTPEVRDVWDLEMHKSLEAAAAVAFDAKESQALMAESQKYLAKFIKEKSNHPDAMIALASWGDLLKKRALEAIRTAKTLEGKDKEQYEKSLKDARAGLSDAREKYQQAQQKFEARLAELPTPSKLPVKKTDRDGSEARQRLEVNIAEVQVQLALIDYYLAQTYPDPASADRIAALKKAAQALDNIFQQNRGNFIGMYAHMWHGKTMEELGDLRTALDIYDEVLANTPEPTDRGSSAGLEPMFTEVQRARLNIVAKQNPRQYLPEATVWLKDYRRLKQTEGYQAVALDTAKALLAAAADAAGPERAKRTSEALQMVSDGAKVRSPYQREFVLLRQEILKTSGRSLRANTFDEAVNLGAAAEAAADWQKALETYNKAVEIAEKQKLKDPSGVGAVREGILRVQMKMARDLFDKGKFSECVDLVGKIVYDEQGDVRKDSPAAAHAAALGVAAALNIYATVPENKRPAALEKLMKVSEFIEKNWPDKPEADDARMARGQARLVVGQIPDAIAIFERVNPKSERYAAAMFLAGQSYWRLYVTQKLKTDGAPDKDRMAIDRAKAVQRLTTAVEVFNRQVDSGRSMPRYMLAAQLLLAEIYNEGGDARQAAALYQPLVNAIKAERPETFDADMLRVFLGAVRTYCALDELDKAGDASRVLIELGPDTLQTNEVLVDFARLLNVERKKAEARVTELGNTANIDELNASKARLASLQKLLGKTVLALAPRRELGLGHMIFLGETLNMLGKTAEASQQFQRILKRAETDAEFAKLAQKAMGLIRTELVTALRTQQKYDESLTQVNQLIKENPRALEPLMEKGRILEALAQRDPAKLPAAMDHWVTVRKRLQVAGKKPPEYFEVAYNVANCLVREAESGKDKAAAVEHANLAEKLLKAALVLSPKLNGPDTVAKYKVLLAKAIALQGRSPEPKTEKNTETNIEKMP